MPSEQGEKQTYDTFTSDLKLVSDYSRLNFAELQELEFDTFQLLLRDAFIHKLKQSKEGQEYLETAYILEQSKPNKEALRDKFTKDRRD